MFPLPALDIARVCSFDYSAMALPTFVGGEPRSGHFGLKALTGQYWTIGHDHIRRDMAEKVNFLRSRYIPGGSEKRLGR